MNSGFIISPLYMGVTIRHQFFCGKFSTSVCSFLIHAGSTEFSALNILAKTSLVQLPSDLMLWLWNPVRMNTNFCCSVSFFETDYKGRTIQQNGITPRANHNESFGCSSAYHRLSLHLVFNLGTLIQTLYHGFKSKSTNVFSLSANSSYQCHLEKEHL